MNRVIISTDMDGTLLGHHSYDYGVALPLLQQLVKAEIPVILNTSKTVAEIHIWQQKLGFSYPAIVENGSAILSPVGTFPAADVSGPDEDLHIFGAQMRHLEAFLKEIAPPAVNFLSCDPQIAIELTGLQGPALTAARDRQFSIPLKFQDTESLKTFSRDVQARGLHCVEGGRFISLQGRCNKGTTLKHLVDYYAQAWRSDITVIALGDNHNDLNMLKTADIPVVVNTDNGHLINVDHPDAIYTQATAPNGWNEGVKQALAALSIQL